MLQGRGRVPKATANGTRTLRATEDPADKEKPGWLHFPRPEAGWRQGGHLPPIIKHLSESQGRGSACAPRPARLVFTEGARAAAAGH